MQDAAWGFRSRLAEPSGRWLSGVELSAHAAEYARSLGGIDIQQVDFHDIEQSGFDVITFNHVIEHLSDPNETLAHAHSLLDAHGRLLIEVPI